MDDYPPLPLHILASESVCSETTNGWLWYCDEHDTHGNADTQNEAAHMADAHVAYFRQLDRDEDPDPCEVIVWMRTEHERTDT